MRRFRAEWLPDKRWFRGALRLAAAVSVLWWIGSLAYTAWHGLPQEWQTIAAYHNRQVDRNIREYIREWEAKHGKDFYLHKWGPCFEGCVKDVKLDATIQPRMTDRDAKGYCDWRCKSPMLPSLPTEWETTRENFARAAAHPLAIIEYLWNRTAGMALFVAAISFTLAVSAPFVVFWITAGFRK